MSWPRQNYVQAGEVHHSKASMPALYRHNPSKQPARTVASILGHTSYAFPHEFRASVFPKVGR